MAILDYCPIYAEERCYTVSEASQNDSSEIISTVSEAFFHAEHFRKKNCPRLTSEIFFEYCQRGTWYVLRQSGDEAGKKTNQIVSVIFIQKQKESTTTLQMFATRVQLWNKGLGTILIKEIFSILKKAGIHKLTLSCVNNPRLVTYYRKLGFNENGKTGVFDSLYLEPEFVGKITTVEMERNLL